MSARAEFDVIVVGSGPSGVHAADVCVNRGLKTALMDIGFTDDRFEKITPDQPFSLIRATCQHQAKFFLGDTPETFLQRSDRAGTHLTPARQHMIQDSETIFPLESSTFSPLQSTGQGGLGISWGSNCFTLDSKECARVGIPENEIQPFYRETAQRIGVSGNSNDDLSDIVARGLPLQPPLQLDSLAQSLLKQYTNGRSHFLNSGFRLGQSCLAVLTQPQGQRRAHAYHDMDFWSNHGKSVYRPSYTLEELKKNSHFTYLNQRKAVSFIEKEDSVEILFQDLKEKTRSSLRCKKLILAAGSINSARLALASQAGYGIPLPILCNPNEWIAALHWPLLGRPVEDQRHSLSQLTAALPSEDEWIIAQFYSYRSLLLHRLVRDLPMHPWFGLQFLRFILTSLTLVNLHFPDRPSPLRTLTLENSHGKEDLLKVQTQFSSQEIKLLRRQERRVLRSLRKLKCLPIHVTRAKHGASIHYAGTLPRSDEKKSFTVDEDGRLFGTQNVHVVDGSVWKSLPAKGLTFTLMANSRRLTDRLSRGMKP